MIDFKIQQFFADLLKKETGISIGSENYYQIDSRIIKLKTLLNLKTDVEVYELFKKSMNDELRMVFLGASTNNETKFFRDKKTFEFIVNHCLVKMIEKGSREINIWSAACSNGQEPYSLVFQLMESGFYTKYPDIKVNISASDIDPNAIKKAKDGIYTILDTQRGLSVHQILKYFDDKNEKEFQLKSDILNKVNFSVHNLLKDPYPREKFDIILCRNVLIYFEVLDRKKILCDMANCLKAEGLLFLGVGETLLGLETPLKQAIQEDRVYYTQESNYDSVMEGL